MASELEAEFALQLRAEQLPEPETEYRFHPPRRYRFDFCWPTHRLAVEIEGHGHQRYNRYGSDILKYNLAALDGWRLLRLTRKQLDDLTGVEMVREALGEQTE